MNLECPILYSKIREKLAIKPQWEHSSLKIVLGRWGVRKQDYPKVLKELTSYGMIKSNNRGVEVIQDETLRLGHPLK